MVQWLHPLSKHTPRARGDPTAEGGAPGLRRPLCPAHRAPDGVPASTHTCRLGETDRETEAGCFKNLEIDSSGFVTSQPLCSLPVLGDV